MATTRVVTVPKLLKGCDRETRAHRLDIGASSFYFSYETLIAYEGPSGRFRIRNSWGPTTGRHFNDMGCGGFCVMGDEAFSSFISNIFKEINHV